MGLNVLPWWAFGILGLVGLLLLILMVLAIVGLSTSKYDI